VLYLIERVSFNAGSGVEIILLRMNDNSLL
jgi:hypothetical protein